MDSSCCKLKLCSGRKQNRWRRKKVTDIPDSGSVSLTLIKQSCSLGVDASQRALNDKLLLDYRSAKYKRKRVREGSYCYSNLIKTALVFQIQACDTAGQGKHRTTLFIFIKCPTPLQLQPSWIPQPLEKDSG